MNILSGEVCSELEGLTRGASGEPRAEAPEAGRRVAEPAAVGIGTKGIGRRREGAIRAK